MIILINAFLSLGLCLVSALGFGQGMDSPCDPKEEAAFEALSKKCETQKIKSKKGWKTLEEAKTESLKMLEIRDPSLLDYIGCDAEDSSRLSTICASDQAMPKHADLMKLFAIHNKSPANILKKGSWQQYGIKKDIWVYCTEKLQFKAAKNYCDENEKLQPVIDIHSSGGFYYIYGIPLSGVLK